MPAPTAHIEDVLLWALAQAGKPYIFGAEAKAADPDPDAFDCSELVEWSCARAGVTPKVPDGAYYQWKHCLGHGLGVSVAQAKKIRGALMFVGDGTGVGRNAITHVAWSLGDGTTIEARGRAWGVGTWPAASRFDFAGLLPGLDYSPGHAPLPPQEDDMPPLPPLRLIACTDPKSGDLHNAWFKTDGTHRSWVPTEGHAKKLVELGLLDKATPTLVGPDFIRELIPVVPSDNHPGADRLHHDDT